MGCQDGQNKGGVHIGKRTNFLNEQRGNDGRENGSMERT